ncbi:MAG: M48 family metallopeptidase [Bacteroidota bacterium]
MKTWVYAFVGYCILFGAVGAQVFHDDHRLSSQGPIPPAFLLSSQSKVARALDQLPDDEPQEVRDLKSDFYEESYYYTNKLLHSGKVLFNDPVSTYLSDLIDRLLIHDPALRAQIQVYAVRSSNANAFATNQGLLLVNLGLISRVNNEAELAFILCHEIAHFSRQHPIDIYLQGEYRKEARKNILGKREEYPLFERKQYSQEKEQEADLVGWELYRKTPYDYQGALGAFDLIQTAELPFGNTDFIPEFLEIKGLRFPDSYTRATIPEMTPLQVDTVPDVGTHPSTSVRKKYLSDRIAAYGLRPSGTFFLLPEKRFFRIREVARFELCHLYLQERAYEPALYHAFLLSQRYPKHQILKETVAYALYGLAKYANQGQFWDVHKDYSVQNGPERKLYYLMEQLSPDELTTLAMLHSLECWQNRGTAGRMAAMTRDLMRELGIHHVTDVDYFSPNVSGGEPDNFVQNALGDLYQDSAFLRLLTLEIRNGKSIRENRLKKEAYRLPRTYLQRELALKGFNLGLKKIVLVEPYYQKYDERKEKSIRYLESEEKEQNMLQTLEKHASACGIQHISLASHLLDASDVASFRDLAVLNEWFNEQGLHQGVDMISTNHNEIYRLRKKYQCDHFVWVGTFSTVTKRRNAAFIVGAGVVVFPLLPIALYYGLTPAHETMLYASIYDIKTGKYVLQFPKKMRLKDKDDLMNSVLYDLMYQISYP